MKKQKLFKKAIGLMLVGMMLVSSNGIGTNVKATVANKRDTALQNFEEVTFEEATQEATIVKELTDKRTENSNTYLLSDGSKKLDIYIEDIRFKEEGKWIEYDTTLISTAKKERKTLSKISDDVSSYAYVNASGNAKQFFSNKLGYGEGIILEKDNYAVSLIPDVSEKYVADIESDVITYASKGTGVTYQHTSLKNGVRENIILDKSPESNRLKFDLNAEGLMAVYEKNSGKICFVDDEENVVAELRNLNLIDAKGNINYEDVRYILSEDKESLWIEIDEEYLSSDDTAYPIVADSYFTWIDIQMNAASVDSYAPRKNITEHSNVFDINYNGNTRIEYLNSEKRGYVYFDADYLKGKYVKVATFGAMEATCDYSPATIEFRSPKTSWDANTITWNNQPEMGDEVWASFTGSNVEGKLHFVDVTKWARAIASGEIENTGFVLSAKDKGTGTSLHINNVNFPYMSNYHSYVTVILREGATHELVEYNYTTGTERTFNYIYDKYPENATETGYIPANALQAGTFGDMFKPIGDTASPNNIYKGDTLYPANHNIYPYSTIVKLLYPEGNNGSGYVIGPNVIATAGHCVGNSGGWVKQYTICIDNLPTGYHATKVIRAKSDDEDWAIIIVDGNIGDRTGWMGFGIPSTDMEGATITVAGYCALPTDATNTKKLYTRSGNLFSVNIDKGKLEYYISTNGGQSGGPIFGVNNISYGMHTNGHNDEAIANSGARINECIFTLMRDKKKDGITLYQ